MSGFPPRGRDPGNPRFVLALAQLLVALADAADGSPAPRLVPDEVTVVATTPLPGTAIDVDKVPSRVESLRSADIRRGGSPNLIGALNEQFGSITLNDTLADPFQPDILYRGFEASAVLGTPQGLAVYQNGVRLNEAFGDALNWDLIPDFAIRQLDLVSANPVYGLNALGGAASLVMKDGFTDPGVEAIVSGGSFRQRDFVAEAGGHGEQLGYYVGARVLDQDGWRQFARDRVRQLYASVGRHAGAGTLDLHYTHADNQLHGQGAAPVQSLALDRSAVFTGPQHNFNQLDFATLNGSYEPDAKISAQGALYYRGLRQQVANGNTSDYVACVAPASAGLLCQPDAQALLVDAAGHPLPDITHGGTLPLGQNDFERIHSTGLGGSWQLHGTGPLRGLGNQFTAGASVDVARVEFLSGAELGVIDPNLAVQAAGLFVDTPEGTGFGATPVMLDARTQYYGVYATDTLDATAALALTASGRFNVARIDLRDRRGQALSGLNHYAHFNPALGATYKVSASVTFYGGYSATSRAPTASEIECSDPLLPCLLPASLAGDPPTLKQVVAHTIEIGLRSHAASRVPALTWSVGAFRSRLEDDIHAVATSLSTGYYQNIGSTSRQGGHLALAYRGARAQFEVSYDFVDARVGSPFALNSPSNPGSDANGNIAIACGSRMPGIPRHRIKASTDLLLSPRWSLGASLLYSSPQFLRGDESNQGTPLGGYTRVALRSAWRPSPGLELFLDIDNLASKRYATFGLYGDPTGVGAPGIPADAASNDARVDNRFESLGAPRSLRAGIRIWR